MGAGEIINHDIVDTILCCLKQSALTFFVYQEFWQMIYIIVFKYSCLA